jgi:hypothetical protein
VDETSAIGSIAKCPTPARLYRESDLRRIVVPCGQRRCSWCGPNIWRKRVLAGLHAGLRAAPPAEYLAILLTAPAESDAREFNAAAPKRWARFNQYLREAYPGADLGFWKVAELQERGHVHFHVVVRGLRWLPVPRLRAIARRAGFGPWVGIRRPASYKGGPRSLGWYFTKYLMKDYGRSIRGVVKLVTFSNGWRAGWKRPERMPGGGRWLFVGPVPFQWLDRVGYVVEEGRRRRSAPPEDRRWPLTERSWQAARAAEALTEPLPF